METLNFNLTDKVFVITGASRGIGLEMARIALSQGAKVAICARKVDGLAVATADLNAGDRLISIPAHVARPEDVENLFDQAMERFGRVDALINNVGMNLITGLADSDIGVWQKIIDSNLNAAYLCSRKAARIMKAQKSGKIVSISSIAAHRSMPVMGIYGVAKAGIEMMTRVLAHELAAFQIQVNAVAPGMVKTRFSQPFWSNPELYDQIVRGIPLGRLAEPIDVVYPALFLCSDAANFITGQTLIVDGGASIV
ncbi:MAG: SDR family NAD(P)-dependent oxidoreductase [Desulfatirhabdiaceae bacterium]